MKLLLAVTIIACASATQWVPIATPPDGFAMGPTTTNYTLEVFYDHLCSDSAAAWPGLFQYWQQNKDWLQLVIHIHPLPYHYYAFIVGVAGRFIQLNYPQNFTDFVTWMFVHQDKYLDTALYWNLATIKSNLATDTQTATGAPFGQVANALNNNAYYYDLGVSTTYAFTRGITGTPQYLINGIWSPDATTCETPGDWTNLFQAIKS
ncbi:unnamed protein product [Blepharisma stoltei]|uniref:Thioredoxin-like fold domain-containing protein n=1 Tax=Blepharisma stoltei TaxID=1481888 RepID=A0AAU9ICD8_9CILI|nr:unnamed protein product [Blepharisma stoltei]